MTATDAFYVHVMLLVSDREACYFASTPKLPVGVKQPEWSPTKLLQKQAPRLKKLSKYNDRQLTEYQRMLEGKVLSAKEPRQQRFLQDRVSEVRTERKNRRWTGCWLLRLEVPGTVRILRKAGNANPPAREVLDALKKTAELKRLPADSVTLPTNLEAAIKTARTKAKAKRKTAKR